MMKKVLATLALAMVTMIAVAQDHDTRLKFLGIPIDGTKAEMISALKAKGFKQDPEYENVVHGEFNGRESNIHIVENRGKVYRILVADANTLDEGQIRIRYNNLIRQFENSNGKYFKLTPVDPIPEDEDISYEITVHDKQYQATFYYNPAYDDEEWTQRIVEESIEECNELLEEKKDEKMAGLDVTLGEYYADEDNYNSLVSMTAGLRVYKLSNSTVWFTIHEFGGKYYISLYYDNMDNQANGEDL